MDGSIKSFIKNFKQWDALVKLIVINGAVFLFFALIAVFEKLFNVTFFNFNSFLAVSSDIRFFLFHIWTLFTYMFVHYALLHILFNMLMLYWFGKIFLMYFTSKNLVALYILGGFAGALLYVVSYNTIPYFILQGSSFLVGASASVTAIIFASAFYNRNLEVRLLFIGSVKIIYIALAIFVIDFISLGGESNIGGHIAHIGGALVGYLYAQQFLKGKDITKGLNKLIDIVVNLFKKQPQMTIKHKKPLSDFEYNQRKHNESEDIDHILDKIKLSGYKSLNEDEKKRLFDASKK